MKILSKNIITFTVLAASVLSSWQALAEGEKISGTAALSYTKQEVSPAPSAAGHMLVFGELTGVNKNTSSSNYMSDAEATNREVGQLFQGNGPQTGYYTMSKDGNTTTALWKGVVTTVLAEDRSPRTSFEGTWE